MRGKFGSHAVVRAVTRPARVVPNSLSGESIDRDHDRGDSEPVTPEQWARVKAVFEAAIDRPPHERVAFAREACAGDAAMLREVTSLLAAHDEPSSFLESPAVPSGLPNALFSAAPPASLLEPGALVGRFRVLALLGVGGMGEVYLAEDGRLGRKVAVKLLPRDLAADAGRYHRFAQEGRAASALTHPNVCIVHEVGDAADGRPFLVMEYIEGDTLRDHLQRHAAAGTRMPIDEVLAIATQVAASLEAAHDVGIIHRDVKPENVMVRRDQIVKVLDFGLAKLTDRSSKRSTSNHGESLRTAPGTVLGTAQYMAPEQARGLTVDWRADVWSLGAMMYEMLAGRPAFAGETASDVMMSVLASEPVPLPRDTLGAVPPELQRLVMRMLHKDPRERVGSMREIADELTRIRQQLIARRRTMGPSGSDTPAALQHTVPLGLGRDRAREAARPVPEALDVVPQLTLTPLAAGGAPHTIALHDQVVIGRRTSTVDIAFPNDPGISNVHCVLVRQGSVVFVRDLGSTNGTHVNGVRIHSDHRVEDDDVIQIGKSELRVSLR
jgi:serine/threonine protein kinase